MNLIPQNGIYRVGTQTFTEKIPALRYASQTKEQVTWDYGDKYFSMLDWSYEPPETLSELYEERCRQLRDKYDYLVLYFSGGSDSHNMVTHFQRAGVHIDEIVSYWPIEYFNSKKPATDSTKGTEIQNEWFHTAKPALEKLKKELPNTKITIRDTTRFILEQSTNIDVDEWIKIAGEHISIDIAGTSIERYTTGHMLQLYDKKYVGHIHGIDKPRVFRVDGEWYFAFLDSVLGLPPTLESNDLKGVYAEVEHFYWNLDSARLLVKQAHAIKNFFESNPQYNPPSNRGLNFAERQQYDRFVRDIVYPFWHHGFQIDKPQSVFFCEVGDWALNESEAVNHHWHEIYEAVTGSIDSRFLQSKPGSKVYDSFCGFWSKWHKI